MKVLYVIPALEVGGAERVLTTSLQNAPHWLEPSLCVLTNRVDLAVPGSIPVWTSTSRKARIRESLRALKQATRTIRPSWVHSFMPGAGFITSICNVWSGAKHLYSIHGEVSAHPHNLARNHFMHSFSLANASVVTIPSANMNLPAWARHKALVLANCIPDIRHVGDSEQRRCREQLGVTETDIVFLVVARLDHRNKRQDLVIRAFNRLRAGMPDVRLVVVGDGPGADYLESLAGPAVTFVGKSLDVDKWLRIATVFIQSSVSESFGLALAEACTVGLPTLTTPTGIADWLLRDRRETVSFTDEASLLAGMRQLSHDPNLRLQLGRNAQSVIAGRYSTERYWKTLETVYSNNEDLSRESGRLR